MQQDTREIQSLHKGCARNVHDVHKGVQGFTRGYQWCSRGTPVGCGQESQPFTLADMDSQSYYVNRMVILHNGYSIYSRSYFVIRLHTGRIGMEGVPSPITWYCKLDTGVQ